MLERSERSRTNNQHEVLSSTVKGIFSQREYFSKDIASENNVGYKIIRLYDVVLSPQNLWMGNINYNDRFEIGIVSPSYKVFSIADGYDNQFVASMLKTHRALYSYMMVSEQGASIVRRNLNMEAFSQLVFKIPSLDKQREIGYAMSLLKSQLKTANKIIKAYTSQKQYLLRQMFIQTSGGVSIASTYYKNHSMQFGLIIFFLKIALILLYGIGCSCWELVTLNH